MSFYYNEHGNCMNAKYVHSGLFAQFSHNFGKRFFTCFGTASESNLNEEQQ